MPDLGTPELIRTVIGVQDRMLADLDRVEERVRAGEDRAMVEREPSGWDGDAETYWDLHDAMNGRIAEGENEAARMPLRLVHELLTLRWRCSDLRWEIETLLRTDEAVNAAKVELHDSEARIREIKDLLALMGPGPCAPVLELAPAGAAAFLPPGVAEELAAIG